MNPRQRRHEVRLPKSTDARHSIHAGERTVTTSVSRTDASAAEKPVVRAGGLRVVVAAISIARPQLGRRMPRLGLSSA